MPAITNKSIAYLYTRHGGSAELAPPMAEGIRLVREKEKRKAKDPPMFTVASLPRRVGAARWDLRAYNWSKSRLRRVKDQAEDRGHTQNGSVNQ